MRVNELVNDRRGVTPGAALRLAKYFDVSPSFWLNLLLRRALYHAFKGIMISLEETAGERGPETPYGRMSLRVVG